jgi:adenine-specific DNA methylase
VLALAALALREGNAKKPIYEMHKWWARRLGTVFRHLLLSARCGGTTANQVSVVKDVESGTYAVLDPFMGGGTTVVEALKCGCRVVGCDLDPVAWFVTKNEVARASLDELTEGFQRIDEAIGDEVRSLYVTRIAGVECPVTYFFWVERALCAECGERIELHPHYWLSRDEEGGHYVAVCPSCGNVFEVQDPGATVTCPTRSCGCQFDPRVGVTTRGRYRCPGCRKEARLASLTRLPVSKRYRMFAVEYRDTEDKRKYKAADNCDVRLYARASTALVESRNTLLYPRAAIPTEGRNDKRPVSHGFTHYYNLFNDRQLYCLSLIFGEIVKLEHGPVADGLMLAFSDALAANNLLCPYAFDYQKLTPLFGLHAYNVVQRPVENNVWGAKFGRGSFSKCVRKMTAGKQYALEPYELEYENGRAVHVPLGMSLATDVVTDPAKFDWAKGKCLLVNGDSRMLDFVPRGSIDLVLTDPPYFDNLVYAELSDFYYQWIREYWKQRKVKANGTAHAMQLPSLVVPAQNDDSHHVEYAAGLAAVFAHCRRALKSRGRMVFTYHHRDPAAWACLCSALRRARFAVEDVMPVRSEGKSGFHSTEGNIKWDAVLTCKRASGRGQLFIRDVMLRSVGATLDYWRRVLADEKYGFAEADQRSLAMALAVGYLSQSSEPGDLAAEIAIVEGRAKRSARAPGSG